MRGGLPGAGRECNRPAVHMRTTGRPFLPRNARGSRPGSAPGGAAETVIKVRELDRFRAVLDCLQVEQDRFAQQLEILVGEDRAGAGGLIAAELVGAATGLGQLIFSGAEYHRADIIVGGCLLIGVIAMAMDRWLLLPVERRTVVRWGLIARDIGAGR